MNTLKVGYISGSTVPRVRGVTTLQALLANTRRDARRMERIGTWWTTTAILTMRTRMTTAEVSEVGVTVAATEGEGSARRGSSGGRNT